jgi:hypothetical protein
MILDKKIMKNKKPMRASYGLSVHGQGEIDAVVRVLKGNTALGGQCERI